MPDARDGSPHAGDETPPDAAPGDPTTDGPTDGAADATTVTPRPSSGKARELVRGGRRAPRRPDPAGRRHHMGAVPERMPVLRPDGSAGTTRTSVVQLTSATRHRLEQLVAELETEMSEHAAEGRYEEAAWSRDELAAARAELARRDPAG